MMEYLYLTHYFLRYFPTCYANGASWIDSPYSTDVTNFIDSLKQR